MAKGSKGKRRNSEKRKEKSRDAARSRRGKESEVFTNLSNSLPIPKSVLNTLDKASIMRVAISHLKLRKLLGKPPGLSLEPALDVAHMTSLDGVLMVIAREGDIVYLSDNCCHHLGLTQIELIGQSIYEFTNEGDRPTIRGVLEKTTMDNMGMESNFFMRLKCTLTSKGKNINLKSATYKVMQCRGHCYPVKDGEDDNGLACLILVAQPVSHPSNIDIFMDAKTLLTRHHMNMNLSFVDPKLCALLGFEEEEMKGRSIFDLYHAEDIQDLHNSFKLMKEMGQVRTGVYRLLAKRGGYVYVQTEATVIYNVRTEVAEHIVCLNYVVSEVEEPTLILADFQMGVPAAAEVEVQAVAGIKEDREMMLTQSLFALNTQDTTVIDADEMYQSGPTAEDVMDPLDYEDPDPKLVSMESLFQDRMDPASGSQLLAPPPCRKQEHEDYEEEEDEELVAIKSSPVCRQPTLIDLSSDSSSSGVDEYLSPDHTLILNPEEVDMSQRAPYISMSGDDDLVFEEPEPCNMDELSLGANINMTGKTEMVFSSLYTAKDSDRDSLMDDEDEQEEQTHCHKRRKKHGLGRTDEGMLRKAKGAGLPVVAVKRARISSLGDSVSSEDAGEGEAGGKAKKSGVLFNLLLGREVVARKRTYKLPPVKPSPYSPLQLSPASSVSSSPLSSPASSPAPSLGEKNVLRDLLTCPLLPPSSSSAGTHSSSGTSSMASTPAVAASVIFPDPDDSDIQCVEYDPDYMTVTSILNGAPM